MSAVEQPTDGPHWMPPPELVCPREDCLGWKDSPDAADCGNHEEWMT